MTSEIFCENGKDVRNDLIALLIEITEVPWDRKQKKLNRGKA